MMTNSGAHLDDRLLEVVDVVLDGGGWPAAVPALRLAAGPGHAPAHLVPPLSICKQWRGEMEQQPELWCSWVIIQWYLSRSVSWQIHMFVDI